MAEPLLDPKVEVLKRRAATLSLGYNVALTIIKFVAAILTGSVSMLLEAVHSGTDVVASAIAFVSVRAASRPPDEDHPYGHGKIESLAGLAESMMLLMIVGYILYEATGRLKGGEPVQNVEIGLWVMGISALSSLFAGLFVTRIGKSTQSVALRSNGQHLMVDFWTSVGVLGALAATKFTGWKDADAWVAIGLAVWIAWGAISMSRHAIDILIDRTMPDEEVAIVRRILDAEEGCMSYHGFARELRGTFDMLMFISWCQMNGL